MAETQRILTFIDLPEGELEETGRGLLSYSSRLATFSNSSWSAVVLSGPQAETLAGFAAYDLDAVRTYGWNILTNRPKEISYRAPGAPQAIYAAAAKRHRALARRLRVTIGWDGDMLDDALQTADFMINSNPPKERLRERAPRLQWIQTTGAGIDGLLPLDWLPADITLTNNSGAHGDKAEDYCAMALLMLQTRTPAIVANQRDRKWQPIFTAPIAGKTAVVIGDIHTPEFTMADGARFQGRIDMDVPLPEGLRPKR